MDKITLYYFTVDNKVTLARGENVKLLLEDAALDHEYVRLSVGEKWAEIKAQLIKEGAHSCTLPYIEVKGQRFFKTIPIMRYISAKLNYKYHGDTPEDTQVVDVVTELTDLWFESFKSSYFGNQDVKDNYMTTVVPQQLDKFEKYYSDRSEGPYLLGNKISYADFLVYHMIDDDYSARKKLDEYPYLEKFVTAFEARPNIKRYLESLHKQ